MSDSSTTLDQLKKEIKTFCEERDWDQYHAPKELATGLIIEVAELLDHFSKVSGKPHAIYGWDESELPKRI